MSGSISALNGLSPFLFASLSTSAVKLSPDTKKQLEALGVDTNSIKTEAQGICMLLKVKQTKSMQKDKTVQGAQGIQKLEDTDIDGQKEVVKSQLKISNGMTGIANYNRIFHNLS